MEPVADMECQLKINVHCEMCKRSLMEAIRSICGVYSVSIDARDREGIATVSGEVDPNMLLGALARSGRHAELLNVRIRHPELRRRRYIYHNAAHGYGSSLLGYEPSSSYRYGSGSSRLLPDSAVYYEDDRDLYYPRRPAVAEYPYSYGDNYQFGRARYVPSYPLQYNLYDRDEPLSFGSIM